MNDVKIVNELYKYTCSGNGILILNLCSSTKYKDKNRIGGIAMEIQYTEARQIQVGTNDTMGT